MNKLILIGFIFGSISVFNAQLSEQGHSFYVVEDTSKYTYGMIVDDLAFLYANFTSWVHPVSVGKSEFGLELSTVRIGYEEPKPRSVFLVGNIHAREYYSSKLLMKFLNIFLLNLEGKDSRYPNALHLLDSIDLYIMPVANPDGLKIAQLDFDGIQDSFDLYKDDILVLDTYQEWKANGKGVDLNATFDDGNHDVKRAGNYSECPCSEGYKGVCPAEPVETQAIQAFVDRIRPLITVSFHTKGDVFYWADKGTHHFFNDIDTKINTAICEQTGFELARVSKNPKDYACGLENFVRSRYKLIGTCVELSPAEGGKKQFPDNLFNEYVWKKAWNVPYLFIENAVRYASQIEEISIEGQ